MKLNTSTNLLRIVDLLMSKTRLSEIDAAKFLKELFAVIADRLVHEETVEIESLGVFRISHVQNDDEKYYYLDFTPSVSLNDAINKPFANFEQTKLNEGVIFDNIREIESNNAVVGKVVSDASVLFIVKDENKEEDELDVDEQIDNEVTDIPILESMDEDDIIVTTIDEEKDNVIVEPPSTIIPEIPDKSIGNLENKPIRKRNRKRRNIAALVAMIGVVIVITASAFFFETSSIE